MDPAFQTDSYSRLPALDAGRAMGADWEENCPNDSRIEPLNRSSRRQSALTSVRNQMERTHVRCYRVQGGGPFNEPVCRPSPPWRNGGILPVASEEQKLSRRGKGLAGIAPARL
jgi:hypothetical protein